MFSYFFKYEDILSKFLSNPSNFPLCKIGSDCLGRCSHLLKRGLNRQLYPVKEDSDELQTSMPESEFESGNDCPVPSGH